MKFKRYTIILAVFLLTSLQSVYAGPIRYTNEGQAAALTEELLDKAISYAVAKDLVALQKLIDQGQVIIWKDGVKVEVLDTKIFSGTAQVRPFGEDFELWTVLEALRETEKKEK